MKELLLAVSLTGCTLGVPKEAVSDATQTIIMQAFLGHAALSKCIDGDQDQCARVGLNLDNIDKVSVQLKELTK